MSAPRLDPQRPAKDERDEFFIGWQEPPARAISRRSTAAAVGLAALAVLVALLLAAKQKPFAEATFDYGAPRDFTGRLQAAPVPMLWVSPHDRHPEVAGAGYALVAAGKHGLAGIAAWDGRPVRLSGTLTRRGGRGMIEVQAGSIAPAAGAVEMAPAAVRLGRRAIDGVVVDAKCYLGVMNPGEGKIHRDCAVRCLSGGVPALLVARGPGGETWGIWLTGPGGRPIGREILDRVAEPVRVRGEMVRFDDQFVLEAEPGDVVRLRDAGRPDAAR